MLYLNALACTRTGRFTSIVPPMAMSYRLLLSGDRSTFTSLTFNPNSHTLKKQGDFDSPHNASWIEPVGHNSQHFIGLSEGDPEGSLYTFRINEAQREIAITSQKPTLGAPAHFVTLKDDSAIALATYLGGSISLYSVKTAAKGDIGLASAEPFNYLPSFAYGTGGSGPVESRQRQCHIHQVLEAQSGLLYAPDLGSDRVWVLRRDGLHLYEQSWLQLPVGSGPRHCVFNSDETVLFVLGELSHRVYAYSLENIVSASSPGLPIETFNVEITPPGVSGDQRSLMDSAELCRHPHFSQTLYASNRWERHIATGETGSDLIPEKPAKGDSIAIIVVSEDNRQVSAIFHVQTRLDTIRGIRLSPDGRYMAAVGQQGGGIEIYEIAGAQGEEWHLRASLSAELESGIKHVVWY